MRKFVGLAVLCLLSHCVLPAQSTICWVDRSEDFHERMPLVLKANSDEFIYPSKCGSKSLRVTFQTNIRAACPADTINVLGSNTNLAEAKLSCYGITLFGVGGTNFAAPFRQIRCNRVPEAEVQATTTACANGTISRIGFAVSSSSFVPTIEEVCSNVNQTHWTHHKVVAGLIKRSKPSILGGDGNGGLLGSLGSWFQPSSTTIKSTTISAGSQQIIEAPLVPREDMFYRAQQDSTFFSINSVPMYKSIKNANWRLVEDIVRKVASTKRQCATLDVWTGRYNGSDADESTTTAPAPMPANSTDPAAPMMPSGPSSTPRFLFKMVVDKSRSRGIVFVTLNDPTATAITSNEQLCTPYARCSTLYPQFNVVTQGYTHCCTLADFADVATQLQLPTFPDYQPLI